MVAETPSNVGLVLDHVLHHDVGSRIGSQIEGVPTLHFEEISHHAHSQLVQIAAGTGDHQTVSGLVMGEQVGVELGYDQLGGCGAKVLLGDADLVSLPQPPDLVLAILENLNVDGLDRRAVFDRLGDQLAGLVPVARQQQAQIALAQVSELAFDIQVRSQL